MNDVTGQAGGFDLSALELQDFGTLRVMNAAGDGPLLVNGVQVEIDLWGPGSQQAVDAERSAGLKLARRGKEMARRGPNEKDAEKFEEFTVDKLVARTKEIRNLPLAPRALYENHKLNYITKQVMKWMDEDANFSQASSST